MLRELDHDSGVETYWSHVVDAASVAAFNRKEAGDDSAWRIDEDPPLLSIETTTPNKNQSERARRRMEFATFAKNDPDRFFAFLSHLRLEFQELAIEYFIIGKYQTFLGHVHGFIQTRVWENLRIIEDALLAMIVLSPEPDAHTLLPIILKAGLEDTPYGSLTRMIAKYAETQSYVEVAKTFGAPVPAIRKIFRPALETLLAASNEKTRAVGYYLRNLTHRASLSGRGLSKSCIQRYHRIQIRRFRAPHVEDPLLAVDPLMEFGAVERLGDTPWMMFELSPEEPIAHIRSIIQKKGKHLFRKKAAQVFTPLDANGDLAFGYILARCTPKPEEVKALLKIRGIAELIATYREDGTFDAAVLVPNADIQRSFVKHNNLQKARIHKNDYVEILTGPAAHYYGTVTTKDENIIVEVNFPSGRRFIVTADPTALRVIPNVPAEQRKFWGVTLYPKIYPSAEQTESPASQESAE